MFYLKEVSMRKMKNNVSLKLFWLVTMFSMASLG